MGAEDAHVSKTRPQDTEECVNGIAFDAGGLIALEHNHRQVLALVAMALEDGESILVPATALAQVLRNPARQVRLWRLIQRGRTEIVPLDRSYAQAVGALLARTGTADIADAHIVVCAQKAGHAVITSDPHDLRRLDPKLRVIAV